ncbi:response regulator [Peredibacter starrii]|uniref:Uncharacterized protein n=1 Tax=Peredibacter starrii TaxID=28202 RepID=A0AAX4HJB6_9BACT|nr:hypothetical protein [Peredibacter starrii]WPU63314.1 hypothetical protein SOO65_11520 [Peredibacter starrii]
MSNVEEDDKPTVVLDLNALKKQKLKQEEDLANIASELEFNVGDVDSETYAQKVLAQKPKTQTKTPVPVAKAAVKPVAAKTSFPVILFDFQSDFFQKSKDKFPEGFEYHLAKDLAELNKFLASKTFQVVVFNYDVNAKAVNQLTAQIKQKFPHTKTLILARAISPEKAKLHAKTASGANGYLQLPLNADKLEAELLKIQNQK